MKENQPSGTAQRVAMRRAAHQLLDNPKVFYDPLALRIIGQEGAAVLQADPLQHESSRLSPYLRASLAARSRYAEEELADGLQRVFANTSSWEPVLTPLPTGTHIYKMCCGCSKWTTRPPRFGSERAWRRWVSPYRLISLSPR